MAHLAILCPPLPGHINPMSVLARSLQHRGHQVTFLGFPDMDARLSADLDFAGFAEAEWPKGSLEPFLSRLGRLGGPLSLRRLILDIAAFTDTSCRHLPQVLERLQPDMLIVDQTDAAGSLAAKALSVPFVNIANALPLNGEPTIPPPVLPWRFDPSDRGIRRNLGGYRVARFIERPITRVLRRHARRLGRPDIQSADDSWSELAQITQCVRGLDFPRQQLPENFHYVGPLRDLDVEQDLDLPENGRPLVFCSLGTLQGSRKEIFRAVARAAADLDLNLLIAHGGMLGDREIARLPGSPIVRAFVPQRALLPHCALAVTHCGFNTVLDALNFGVPMVALPLAFEQPATAARLEHAGAARMILRWRSAGRIRRAMEQVLHEPAYRDAARRLSQEILASGGAAQAVSIIETALASVLPAGATRAGAANDGVRGDSRSGSN